MNKPIEKTLKAGTTVKIEGIPFELSSDIKIKIDEKDWATLEKMNRPKLSAVIKIDDQNDLLIVNGAKFAGDLIRGLTEVLEVGKTFQIIERKDGVITVMSEK